MKISMTGSTTYKNEEYFSGIFMIWNSEILINKLVCEIAFPNTCLDLYCNYLYKTFFD